MQKADEQVEAKVVFLGIPLVHFVLIHIVKTILKSDKKSLRYRNHHATVEKVQSNATSDKKHY